MKVALKAGDAIKLSVLRMAISAIKIFEIEKNVKAAQDPDVMQILQRQIKQHKDSIDQFEKGKRQDLADKEREELKILETYVPRQLTEEELLPIIKDAIAQTGAVEKKDAGKVMKFVMEKTKGSTDGKTVNQLVLKLLK